MSTWLDARLPLAAINPAQRRLAVVKFGPDKKRPDSGNWAFSTKSNDF
jgi:hypothetical protein